jgi:flagellar basal-body rod protein FlgG
MAQEHRINITSNNLANISTPGFKREVPIFDGYIVKATKTDFQQGPFESTENQFDLALSGPGFFQVETPQGVRYTRNGNFTVTNEGRLVNMEGHPVVGDVTIPEGTVEVHIATDGRVFADNGEIGQIEIVEFEDPNVLAKEGYSLFVPKTAGIEGQPAVETTVEQGFLERSNADPVMESVNLIDTMRTYEVFQKIVHSFQELNQKVTNEVGRLT